MKKTYKIDVDCANCANKMEEATRNTAGVKDATVNFMMLKMIVEFEDGQDPGLRHLREIKITINRRNAGFFMSNFIYFYVVRSCILSLYVI